MAQSVFMAHARRKLDHFDDLTELRIEGSVHRSIEASKGYELRRTHPVAVGARTPETATPRRQLFPVASWRRFRCPRALFRVEVVTNYRN